MKKIKSTDSSTRSKDYKHLWHPFTQFEEWIREEIITIDRARGVYLYDSAGNKYIDGVSSLWCNIHGHNVPGLNNALIKQLNQVAHSTFLGLTHKPGIELAEKLIVIAPKGLTRVFYSDSGSEAVESALKISFQYWQQSGAKFSKKKLFLTLNESYHGDTVGAVSLGSISLFHSVYGPLLFKTIKAPTTYSYRCKKANSLESCAEHCLEEIESIMKRMGNKIAALVIEPTIQGAGGMIIQPDGFVKTLRKLCYKYGILMITDEVATGFGRTGTMFAVEHDKISPDIMVIGKGLTGGYLPLAATLTTEEIFRKFRGDFSRTFFHGHTYTANPLACAVSLANLALFKKNIIIKQLQPKISLFSRLLRDYYDIPIVGEVRQRGFMAGIELVANRSTKEPFDPRIRIGRKVSLEARKFGVIIRSLGDVLVLMPPLVIDSKELLRLAEAVIKAIQTLSSKYQS